MGRRQHPQQGHQLYRTWTWRGGGERRKGGREEEREGGREEGMGEELREKGRKGGGGSGSTSCGNAMVMSFWEHCRDAMKLSKALHI